jgi:hypothetical protein
MCISIHKRTLGLACVVHYRVRTTVLDENIRTYFNFAETQSRFARDWIGVCLKPRLMTTYARTCGHVQEREHIVRSRNTVISIETRLPAGQPRNTFSIPWQVQEVWLYSKACRPTLGSTQPTVQWVPIFSSWSRAAGACTDHSPLYGAEIKNTWTYTSTPPYFLMAYVHMSKFTLLNFTFFRYLETRKY